MKTIILIITLLQSAQDVFKSATADFEAGRWAEAAAKYETVLKEDASLIQSRFNLAVCYSKMGNIEGSIAAYRTLLDQNGTIYEARVNLAVLLNEKGQRPEAAEQFEKALALRPDDAQARLNLGMFYLSGNELDKALPHLLTSAEKGLNSSAIYAALADAEHARNNETKSREYLRKAIALDNTSRNLKHQLAVSFFTGKEYSNAAPLLAELVQTGPGNADDFYMLGKSYEEMKSYPQAIAALQQAIRIKSDYGEAYGTLGAVFYAQQDWQRASQAVSRVIDLQPRLALPHFVLATCLDNLGNAREALVQYNKFLELDDGSNDARSFQARQRARTLERRLKR